MLVYRITHKKFSHRLFASGLKGRWNSSGNKVIYAADSIALAFLENMIRRQGVGFNDDFRIMLIMLPDDLAIFEVPIARLDENWRDFNDYSSCQVLGDEWYLKRETLVLKVPSAVLPESSNYVIHSEHEDFNRVEIVGVTNLIPDQRIEEILKQYGAKK